MAGPITHVPFQAYRAMRIGIIGGTGLDNPAIMSDIKIVKYDKKKVPKVGGKRADYGRPSGHLVTGER